MSEWLRAVRDLEAEGVLLVQDGNHGEYRPRPSEFADSGTAFIRATDMRNGRVLFESAQKVNEVARGRIRKGIGANCDVILSHKGTVGKVAFVPPGSPSFVCSPQTTFWRSLRRDMLDPRYLYAFLQSASFRSQLRARENESDMAAYVSLTAQRGLVIAVPPLQVQRAISSFLGALDDKIAVNERIAARARDLGLSLFRFAVRSDDPVEVSVESVTTVLTRGVAPKYTVSPEGLAVLNQKCIRDGRANLEPSRLTLREKVKSPKLLQPNDVLVNSTGVGTLGRVARWTSNIEATVDSHITIVRFDERQVDPVCAGFALLLAQPEIEAMGEGSTGQTELRRAQVGGLDVTLPSSARQKELRIKLDTLEDRASQALSESGSLAALRDTLLPQLMSGKLRVREAERVVEDAV